MGYNLISSVTVGSSTNEVVFSGLPQTYKDLLIIGSQRTDITGSNEQFNGFLFNGVTSSGSYGATVIRVDNGTGSTFRQSDTGITNVVFGSPMPSNTTTLYAIGTFEMYIANYAVSSWNKTATNWGHSPNNAADTVLSMTANSSTITDAITTLTVKSVYAGVENFIAGSVIALYGIS